MNNGVLIDASYACWQRLEDFRREQDPQFNGFDSESVKDISLASIITAMELNIWGVDSVELTQKDKGVVHIVLNDDDGGWDWAEVSSSIEEVEGYLRFRFPQVFKEEAELSKRAKLGSALLAFSAGEYPDFIGNNDALAEIFMDFDLEWENLPCDADGVTPEQQKAREDLVEKYIDLLLNRRVKK